MTATPGEQTPADTGRVLHASTRGDGRQWLERVPFGSGSLVIKHYGSKRGRLRGYVREFGHRVLAGKTSQQPGARRDTERRILALWRRYGFGVPQLCDEGDFGAPGDVCLAMEFIDAPTLEGMLAEPAAFLEAKQNLVRRCADDMGRRHRLALDHDERGLIHVRARASHVLVAGGRMVHCDFEVVYGRRHSVARLASLEIIRFLCSLERPAGDLLPSLVDAFFEGYPLRDQLRRLRSDLAMGPMPGLRLPIALAQRIRPSRWERKRRVVRQIESRLGPPSDVARGPDSDG